jgi:uncharacterized LabA/DUF88 family protein
LNCIFNNTQIHFYIFLRSLMTIIDPNKSSVTTSKKSSEKTILKPTDKIKSKTITTKIDQKPKQSKLDPQQTKFLAPKTNSKASKPQTLKSESTLKEQTKPTLEKFSRVSESNKDITEEPKMTQNNFGYISTRPGLKPVSKNIHANADKIEYKPRESLSLIPKKQNINPITSLDQNALQTGQARPGLKLVSSTYHSNLNNKKEYNQKTRTPNYTSNQPSQLNNQNINSFTSTNSHFALTPAEIIEEINPKFKTSSSREEYKPIIFSDDAPITPNLGIYENQTNSIRGVINRVNPRNNNFENQANQKQGNKATNIKYAPPTQGQPEIRMANLSIINQSNGQKTPRITIPKGVLNQSEYQYQEIITNLDNITDKNIKAAVTKPSPKPILRRVATPTIKKDPSLIKAKGTNNYAFIDCQNLWYNLDKDWQLDWTKFFDYLKNQLGVKRGYVFIGFVAGYQKMYQQLQEAGFILIFKPVQETNTGIKCNVDTEMVLQTMIQIANFDKAVIVTGDGDFTCLVEHLLSVKKLEAVMIPGTRSYSHTLEKAGKDKVVFISMLKEKLKKDAANMDDYVPMIISE